MSSFDSYIQTLLGNPNPQGSMLQAAGSNFYTEAKASDYYNRGNQQQESIDAALLQREKDAEALKRSLGQPAGMLSGGGDSGGYDGPSPTAGQSQIGTGAATDAINAQAMQAAGWGFLGGGMMGALGGGIDSYLSGSSDFLGKVNATTDPIMAWAQEQGYAPSSVSPAAVATANQASDPLGALIASEGWSGGATEGGGGFSAVDSGSDVESSYGGVW